MLKPIVINCGDRSAAFSMELNLNFIQDSVINYYLKNGVPPEGEVVQFMCRAVKNGDSVIDVGANVGFFTLLLSQYVGPNGHVLSIEPGQNNIGKLLENEKLSRAANVHVDTAAVAAEAKIIDFFLTSDSGINAAFHGDGVSVQKVKVNAAPLDVLWQRQETPKLIKMDIEGSELEALRGARKLLAKHPNFIIMEFNELALQGMGASVKELRYFMHDFGYELFMLNESGFFPAHIPADFPAKVERNNTNVLFTTYKDLQLAFPEVVV